jgi:glycosyltransferase involved in cell wall biosynthesis
MKVVFLGNLVGGAYMMARPLARKGVDCTLMLATWERDLASPSWESGTDHETNPVKTVRYGGEIPAGGGVLNRLAAHARRACSYLAKLPLLLGADVVQSFTGSLFISRLWFIVFGILRLRPYIACATGSDLRELALTGKGVNAELCRQFFRRARVVLLLNLDMPAIADRLGYRHAKFFPFAVDSEFFVPKETARRYGREGDLLIFMPSHLDWGVTDNAPGRSSTKGNDRLIRAFARFVKAGQNGHLIMLDRGPDRELARRLIVELDIVNQVTFLDQMKKQELIEHFNMADVVADQFDIGAFGTTTLEAMACAKPVLVYVDEGCADQCYSDRPPVLNAHSEDEILQALHKSLDAGFRNELGKQARDWVVRHHDAPSVAARLIEIYQTLREGR